MIKFNMYGYLLSMIIPFLVWFGAKDYLWFGIIFGVYAAFTIFVNTELNKRDDIIERQENMIDGRD